jgi:Tol biopolymer transport system component
LEPRDDDRNSGIRRQRAIYRAAGGLLIAVDCRRLPFPTTIATIGSSNFGAVGTDQESTMAEPLADPEPPATAPSEDRLDSWKEIAAYLKRDVTTVQRWEKRESMPVHRHVHDKLGTVYAFRADLNAWARGRNLRVASDQETAPEATADPLVTPAGTIEESGSALLSVSSTSEAASPLSHEQGRRKRRLMAAAAVVAAVGSVAWLFERRDLLRRVSLSEARFEQLTDFDGTEQAAAISRDGRFATFLSDRDGPMDVWLTQIGTGEFHNLTRGGFKELVNPSVRTLGFSPDGSSVTFWTRKGDGSNPGDIGIWALPILGGQPRPYLEGAAEFDWSDDGSRLVYHTTGPGDPMFVKNHVQEPAGRQIFAAPPGLHGHFPLWGPAQAFIYFVQGSLPAAMDIWRIKPAGGLPERITHHNSRVSHPVLLNQRTLIYLASDPGGSGSRLYSVDVDRRIPHVMSSGLGNYTSLAASADGRRLVATVTSPKGTLWRLPIADTASETSAATRISLTTGSGSSPRLGSGYLLYVSSKGASEGIWKLADGKTTQLWNAASVRIIGGPEIAPDGRRIAFSIERSGRTMLYVMNADGADARLVTESLALQGTPAWAPDGQSITSAALDNGVPRLYRIPLDERPPVRWMQEYSVDPVWDPNGRFIVYSGPDIGTRFPVKAAAIDASPYPLPGLTLTRGARHLRFLPGHRALVVMRGEIEHKNLWLIDLDTGTERQLTNLGSDFNLRDFDVSPDGREIVLDRMQEQSDVVLIDLPRDD